MIKRMTIAAVLFAAGWAGLAGATSAAELTIKDTVWARLDDSGKMVSCEGRFRRGEAVHLVLLEVGPFPAGPDGRSWFDLDMTVAAPSGRLVLDKKNLLDEKGHIKLDHGIAESPYGIFESAVGMDAGEYKMTVTIRDRIGSAQKTVVKSFSLAPGLAYGRALFARMDEQKRLSPVEDASFQRGEAVHFVLINVGLFKKGPDGKHAFDVDMEVKDPGGRSALIQKNMLGENGRLLLDKDIAESPYVTFQSALTLPAGTYVVQMTVRDLIGKSQLTVKKPFDLK
jgi:hypothetical protein